MKRIAVCGVGNGITDIIAQVDQALFDKIGLKAGSMNLVSAADQGKLLDALESKKLNLVSGGAVCNSTIIAQQLGAQAAFICRLGDDRYGLHYQEELQSLGIDVPNAPMVGMQSGTSVIIVTPDGERTMSTCLQASADLGADEIDERIIAESEWVFIEGYVISNGDRGQSAVSRTVELAKKHGTKIALTLSAGFVVTVFRDFIDQLIPSVDLVFANHEEATTYTNCEDVKESVSRLAQQVPHVVVTSGGEGVFISHRGELMHVPAYSCTPVDLTGAGDAFAGGYLYGITHNVPEVDSARAACFLAMQVITRIGARLHSGTKEYWEQALRK